MTTTETGLVQPIIIAATGTHGHAIQAAACASIAARHRIPRDPAWEEWLAGSFTKTVRRARASQYEKLLNEQESVIEAQVGDARAFALAPMRYDDFPAAVRRLQVPGTQLPYGPGLPAPGTDDTPIGEAAVTRADFGDGPVVVINHDLAMTTGKAAAQAAHAVWMADARGVGVDELEFCWVSAAVFHAVVTGFDPVAVVTDSGLTEFDGVPTRTVAVLR